MNEYGWVSLYSALILLFSLCGGYLPFLGRVTHDRLQLYLSASAGVMLGASFFHVMPEAMELSGPFYFGWWMSLGVIGLFCIERFIAPHSHEVDSKHDHEHSHHHHEHDHGHVHHPGERRAAAPAVAGWMAVLGLTLHTFMNGVGLAGAIERAFQSQEAAGSIRNAALNVLPGLSMFLAIFLHKPADALAISTVLSRKGVSGGRILLVQIGFALMVPIGAVTFYAILGSSTEALQDQLIGFAYAFSAGTFLFVALSDLLPEVQFHRHDRVPLFLALVAGVVLMGGIAYLEDHDHGAHAEAEHMDHGHSHSHGGHSHSH